MAKATTEERESGTDADQTDQSATNMASIRHFVEELWNKRNLAVVDDLCGHGFEYHDPGLPSWYVLDKQGFKELVTLLHTAFLDFHVSVTDQFAEDDKVVTRVMQTGTQTGPLLDLAPTGIKVTVEAVSIERLVDGKIVESWGCSDQLGMRQQLGLFVPPPEHGH
jgi:predicted ester cyclase